MAEKQTYPWQSGSGDSIVAQLESIPGPDIIFPEVTSLWPLVYSSGCVLGLVALGLITQFWVVQPDYVVFVPDSLAKLPSMEKIELLPSPARYDFFNSMHTASQPQDTVQEEPASAPVKNQLPNIISPTGAIPSVIQSNTPTTTIQLAPPPSLEPDFALIGIAQGSDGNLATVKITQNSATETKDIRVGEPLSPGYVVTGIEDEFVLIKAQKSGKVIRVD